MSNGLGSKERPFTGVDSQLRSPSLSGFREDAIRGAATRVRTQELVTRFAKSHAFVSALL